MLLGNSKTTSQRPCCKEYPGYAGGPGEDQWFWTLQVGRILQTSGIQQGAYQVVREQFFFNKFISFVRKCDGSFWSNKVWSSERV